MEKELKEWIINYIKHKDLLQKKLEEIQEDGGVIKVKYMDRSQQYFLQEKLSNCLEKGKNEGTTNEGITIVCPATRINLNYLLENWEKLIETKTSFIFVNLKNWERWIVHPGTHHKIADEKTLKLGLESMFCQVAGLPPPKEPKQGKKEIREEI